MNLYDRRTDTSRACLVKIAHTMSNRQAAETVIKLAEADLPEPSGSFAYEAERLFPCGSAEDTVLSRVYFNGQREKIASDVAEKIDARLGMFEALYGISGDLSLKNGCEKTALEAAELLKTAELLPGYSVHGAAGLKKAAAEFEDRYLQLEHEDRVEFAENLLKTAETWGADVARGDAVRTYSGRRECDFGILREQLGIRKAACVRSGQDPEFYENVLGVLGLSDSIQGSRLEKMALAQYIHEGDKAHGFTKQAYDRKMPDAWHLVFNCEKTAEEQNSGASGGEKSDRPDALTMTKADVVARYGDEALDAVLGFDGELDRGRLNAVLRQVGDEHMKASDKQ